MREALGSREVSAVEVIRQTLSRIHHLDEEINAVVALRPEEALREAQELDKRFARGEKIGPLAGLPVLVKDLEDVAGMRTTYGSVIFQNVAPATSDGITPTKLRAAGAIVVGKTNLPEFATEGYTSNFLFGTTRNPWQLDWGPGGSSGGSAAALAAGMVPIATATDGGGSIRLPSAHCGLVGLKPTNGLVGRNPIPDWIDFSTDGPMATTVSDLQLLLQLEAGPVAGDPTSPPAIELSPGSWPHRVLAVDRFIPRGPIPTQIGEMFAEAIDMAAQAFHCDVERIGSTVVWRAGMPDDDWYVIATAEQVNRLGRRVVETHLERMHPSVRGFMSYGLRVTIDSYLMARRRRFEYVKQMDTLLRDDAVVISPTVLSAGFPADGRVHPGEDPKSLPFDASNTEIANVTGCPAISLPAGISDNGVPFGLQIVAPRFRDGLLIELAAEWERRYPWPRTAPGYDSFETALGLSL